MENSGGEASRTYLGKAEERDGYGDLDHLPPLLEDEENVSLADILSLRDSCLSEEEVWAVCAQCVLALQSIRPSHLFHTLCITPDTLAFNAHGNVSFMEQLSDDPEGSFVPPEFDNTGSTFEGHVYSLGSTLSAALNFVIEPELEADLGEEIHKLLEQMQEEKPEDRPLLQDVLSLAEERLSRTSSAAVCRKLSSVGRRVLSIESVSNFQDGEEGSWEARWQHSKPRCLVNRLSLDDNTSDPCDSSVKVNGLSRLQLCQGWDSSLWVEEVEDTVSTDGTDCCSRSSSPVSRRVHQRPNGARGPLNRSCSIPDSNNPPYLPPQTHVDISVPVSDLTEIGADEHLGCESVWGSRLQRLGRGRSCESYSRCGDEDCGEVPQRHEDVEEILHIEEDDAEECQESQPKDGMQSLELSCSSCPELETERDSSEDHDLVNLYAPNNHVTKSMLCLNEESQDEWISLRDLLTRCGRRLTVNELWALCYTCLSSLQTYIDFPAYLCLDTVYVGCEGEVLFLKPKNMASLEEFYLAPEYQEHGIVTEKVCVYGIAAILWAAAKFSLTPNQKLAMPRKLKRLLLEMAKRTPIERPSIVLAKKSCHDYLFCQGTNAETVWNSLIRKIHPTATKSSDAEDLNSAETHQHSCEALTENSRGFVPMATESRLAPVPGPVPHSYPVSHELHLPEAFTSTATHFTPIILTKEGGSEGGSQQQEDAIKGAVDQFPKSSDCIEESSLDVTPPSESPCPSNSELQQHTQETIPTSSFTNPSLKMPVDAPSALPNMSCLEVSLSLPLSANHSGCGVFNNYLFRQDPITGRLSLVPVQVRAPESLHGLDINLSLVPQPLQELITVTEGSNGTIIDGLNAPVNPGLQENHRPLLHVSGNSAISDSSVDHTVQEVYSGQTNPIRHAVSRSSPESVSTKVHPALKEVIDLLKGEFSLEYLDNGHKDISMGEYIFSLKDLQYQMFARAVRERFSGLYWEDDLLGVLHYLVNYSPSTHCSNEQPSSKAEKRSALNPHLIAAVWGEKTEVCLSGCIDLNGNIHSSSRVTVDSFGITEAKSCHEETETVPDDIKLRTRSSQDCILQIVAAAEGPGEFLSMAAAGVGTNVKSGGDGSACILIARHSAAGDDAVEEGEHQQMRKKELMGQPAKKNSEKTRKLLLCFSEAMMKLLLVRRRSYFGGMQLSGGEGLGMSVSGDALLSAQEQMVDGVGWREALKDDVPKLASGEKAGSSDSEVMEGRGHSAGDDDESPSEAEFLSWEKEEIQAHDEQMGPDCSEDMEDSESSHRLLSLGSQGEDLDLSFSPAWGLAFYEEDCFSPDVKEYAARLGQHTGSACLEVKAQELQQQLVIERRNLKKTRTFYQKLIQQERKHKDTESKLLLSKLKSQLEELRYRVAFLDSVKKYLKILSVDQWGLEVSLLPSLAFCNPDSLDLQSSEDLSFLSFGTNRGKRSLQAGSPLGLMAYLYARNSAVEGYIQQFLYTYRFFCTPEQLLHFIMDRFISAVREGTDLSGDSERIFHRSLDVLQFWITDCKQVDFTPKPILRDMLEKFLNTEVIPVDSQGEVLLAALHSSSHLTTARDPRGSLTSIDELDDSTCLHSSAKDLGKKWRISRVVEPSASIAAALPEPCYGSLLDDLSVSLHSDERLAFSQKECSAQHIAQQLTLMQQEIFQGCHPVHFLNSRNQGVRDKVLTPNKNVSQHVPAEGSSSLVHQGPGSDSPLQQLLTYASGVTNWISAEIVICSSVKTQAALLTKYLWIGKLCYESRNFATAMQVLGGLENVIVKQLPAWKHLSSKVCEILEELRAVQVFLKSDDLCLIGGDHMRKRPTLPSVHILAMHIQQREIGAFTLTTGAYKWTKLRNIAKVVSQVHAFQEAVYPYSPDEDLQAYLHHRIARLATSDIHLLATDSSANFQESSERQTRRIHDTLRRVKAALL
ncbi:kinase non-catalytic C-lobe domain-containing protein 1 [Pholidichthys leucotaenia]